MCDIKYQSINQLLFIPLIVAFDVRLCARALITSTRHSAAIVN